MGRKSFVFNRIDIEAGDGPGIYRTPNAEGEFVLAQEAIDRDMGRTAEIATMEAQHKTALINAHDDGVKRALEAFARASCGDPDPDVMYTVAALIKSPELRAIMEDWIKDTTS